MTTCKKMILATLSLLMFGGVFAIIYLQSNSNNKAIDSSYNDELSIVNFSFNSLTDSTSEIMAVIEDTYAEVNAKYSSKVKVSSSSDESEYKVSIPEYNIPLSRDVQEHIFELSENYDMSYELILSVIYVESRFDIDAVGKTNDFGLMQLNKPSGTMKWLAGIVEDEFGIDRFDWKNPIHNTTAGIWYLNWIREQWVNQNENYSQEELFYLTLISYNMGLGNANKYIHSGNSIYDWKYCDKVFDFKEKLESGEYNEQTNSDIS